MDTFYLFLGAQDQANVIHNAPDALDQAPYDRIARRHSKSSVDAGYAELALKICGGVAVYADRIIEVAAI